MEDKLRTLVEGNNEINRTKWALEGKKQGKKVIGILCSYVPEEIVYAAGMLPWQITGTWRENITQASAYRQENSCGFCNHVLESLLTGELDFLDGVIATDRDQDLLRLWDVWASLKKTPFCHVMHVPFIDSEIACQQMSKEIRRLIGSLEEYGGVKITQESLGASIDTYNKTRTLLTRMYELRKREVPPLSGAEVLGIMTAAGVMPKDQFNQEIGTLLPYLEGRKTSLKHVHPRLLVSSDMLDNPGYLNLIEEASLVAMDDLDAGSRYLVQAVDTSLADPIYALAKRYISRHGAPRMTFWDKQTEQLVKWVREFDIDGVISLQQTYCYPQMYRMPFLSQKLKEAGISNMTIKREYHLANLGQLRTRIGAFVEMLEVKA